jgi:hypothetical protein
VSVDEHARHAGRLAHHEAWLAHLDHEAADCADEAAQAVMRHHLRDPRASVDVSYSVAALVSAAVARRSHAVSIRRTASGGGGPRC